MSKRRAGMELTHENWDEEEEPEEAGTFAVADKDTMAKRPIIKARRRVTPQQEGSAAPAPAPFAAFKGFSGFGAAGLSAPTKPAASFSFKASSTDTASSKAPSIDQSAKAAEESKPLFSFKSSSDNPPPSTMFSLGKTEKDSKVAANGAALTATSTVNGSKGMDRYTSELTALNKSVSAWIQKHVDSNPLCDLSPIFDDYKKHLSDIEKKRSTEEEAPAKNDVKLFPATVNPLASSQEKSSSSSTATSFTGFKFGGAGSSSFPSSSSTTTSITPGSGGETVKMESFSPKTGFSFGSGASTISGFGTGASSSMWKTTTTTTKSDAPFSFGSAISKPNSSTAATESQDADAQEESDEPPKVEVKVIEEKDALFSTRCKVFYKKDGDFKERGVGMLHVKDNGGSGQILIRADTTLGNVILNIGVSSAMLNHFTKQGKNKNNIMLISPLNPPADKKCPKCKKNYINPQESTACEEGCKPDATPLLLRVKTEAEADKIISELKKIF
ncbi:nuclear pore complex protein Nup50-like [Diadema setosum]|uniref:nuclear pore complex protein Nup50-like n=1 Tax=Diadema setosum TaxID=31175 RepID=UPI003B3A1209